MRTRIMTGVPAALALLAVVFWAPSGLLRSIAIVFSGLAYLEFDSLMFTEKSWIRKTLLSFLVATQVFVLGFDSVTAFHFWIFSGGIIFGSVIFGGARLGNFQDALREVSFKWLGYSYISFLFGFLFGIVSWPEIGRSFLLLLLMIVFLGDTAAYFI